MNRRHISTSEATFSLSAFLEHARRQAQSRKNAPNESQPQKSLCNPVVAVMDDGRFQHRPTPPEHPNGRLRRFSIDQHLHRRELPAHD
ncbi:MAG: hypothetical protein ABTQ32_18010, partial [Myxococcaceae bacterium]